VYERTFSIISYLRKAYVEFLSSVSISLIDDQSSWRRRGRPVGISARKQSEIQHTLGKKPPAAQLSAHMPVAGSRGRCKNIAVRGLLQCLAA